MVAVISLAIGIGANGAAFSFADALLPQPLLVPRPTAVLTIGSADRNRESQLSRTASIATSATAARPSTG